MKTTSPTLLASTHLVRRLPDTDNLSALTTDEAVGYAAQHLNYKHPTRFAEHASSQLAGALRGLNIIPFDPKGVERYKAKRIASYKKRFAGLAPFARKLLMADDTHFGERYGIFCFFSCVIVIVGLGMLVSSFFGGASLLASSTTLTVGLAFCGLFYGLGHVATVVYGICKWSETRLDNYTAAIPKFVLATAAAIHKDAPDTRFSILELTHEDVVVDPFLIVTDPKGNSYFVEVWEEPGFDSKRLA